MRLQVILYSEFYAYFYVTLKLKPLTQVNGNFLFSSRVLVINLFSMI